MRSKVVFITTYPDWPDAVHPLIWNTVKLLTQKLIEEKEKFIVIQIDNERFLVVVKESMGEDAQERVNVINQAFESLLNSTNKKSEDYDIYYATHTSYDKLVREKDFKKSPYHCDLKHESNTQPFETIVKLLNTIKEEKDKEKVAELFDGLCEIIKKKPIIPNFSLLKHQIAHLFLPLDIDLQGIYEVSKQSKDEAVKYLKEVLENKNKNKTFYRQKLADLQFMVAKVEGEVATSLTENDLPDKESILDLLPEDKTIVKEEWEMLLKLSGLGLKENKNNLFNKEDLEVKVDSGIFVFMKLLDDKIGKYCKDEKSININDVNEILDAEPLKKLLEEIGFHSFSLNPFSHWYNFLNSYLDKLREKIVKEEEKSRKIG